MNYSIINTITDSSTFHFSIYTSILQNVYVKMQCLDKTRYSGDVCDASFEHCDEYYKGLEYML